MKGRYTAPETHRGVSASNISTGGGPTPSNARCRSPPHPASTLVHQHFHDNAHHILLPPVPTFSYALMRILNKEKDGYDEKKKEEVGMEVEEK